MSDDGAEELTTEEVMERYLANGVKLIGATVSLLKYRVERADTTLAFARRLFEMLQAEMPAPVPADKARDAVAGLALLGLELWAQMPGNAINTAGIHMVAVPADDDETMH